MTNFTHDAKKVLTRGKWIEDNLFPKKQNHFWYLVFVAIFCLTIILWSVSCRTKRKLSVPKPSESTSSKQITKTFTYSQLADAIFWAEGGKGYDYGIKSVSYRDEKEAREICIRTIINNIKRYNNYGHRDFSNYLQFLANRYAPVKKSGLSKAEQRLNPFWLKNVEWFLNNPKEVI